MEPLNFKEYCRSKSIDPDLFKHSESFRFSKFEEEYNQMSPESFTAQKLFLLNEIRRRFNFVKPKDEKSKTQAVAKPKTVKLTSKPKAVILAGKKTADKVDKESSQSVNTDIKKKADNTDKPKKAPLKPVFKTTSALKPKVKTTEQNTETKKKPSTSLKPKIPPKTNLR